MERELQKVLVTEGKARGSAVGNSFCSLWLPSAPELVPTESVLSRPCEGTQGPSSQTLRKLIRQEMWQKLHSTGPSVLTQTFAII